VTPDAILENSYGATTVIVTVDPQGDFVARYLINDVTRSNYEKEPEVAPFLLLIEELAPNKSSPVW
jgi:hypothetical protein